MTLFDYYTRFITQERPDGLVIDDLTVLTLLIKATEYYSGYARLSTHAAALEADENAVLVIDQNTNINWSEYALIAPLWKLYVEREQAITIEAGQIEGIMLFGRGSSEVVSDIKIMEDGFPKAAFNQPAFSLD